MMRPRPAASAALVLGLALPAAAEFLDDKSLKQLSGAIEQQKALNQQMRQQREERKKSGAPRVPENVLAGVRKPSKYQAELVPIVNEARALLSDAMVALTRFGAAAETHKKAPGSAPDPLKTLEFALIKKWFGRPDQTSVETETKVAELLYENYRQMLDASMPDTFIKDRIADELNSSSSRADCVGGPNWSKSMNEFTPGEPWWFIRFTSEWWSSRHQTGEGFWSKEGIMVHELSHCVLGTADDGTLKGEASNREDRLALPERAKKAPDLSLHEADCYAFFSEGARELKNNAWEVPK